MDDSRSQRDSFPVPETGADETPASVFARSESVQNTDYSDDSIVDFANIPEIPDAETLNLAIAERAALKLAEEERARKESAEKNSLDVENSSDETASSETTARDASAVALAEASELLSQQIIGETPLLPPKQPLTTRIVSSVARHHGLLLALCALLLWGAMSLHLPDSSGGLRLGMRVSHDVIAPRATTVLDRESTQERREEAGALVTPEYDSDASAQNKAMAALNLLLRTARAQSQLTSAQNASPQTALSNSASAKSGVSSRTNRNSSTRSRSERRREESERVAELARLEFEKTRRVRRLNTALQLRGLSPLTPDLATRALSTNASRWPLIEIVARESVRAAYFFEGRVQQIRSDADDDLVLAARRMQTQINENFGHKAANTSGIDRTSTRILTAQASGARAAAVLSTNEKQFALSLAKIAARVPNLVVNARKTERARQEARGDVPAVYRNVLPGSVLVETGNIIDREKWAQLQDLDMVAPRFDIGITIARFILCAILVGFAAIYVARSCPSVLASPAALWLLTLMPPLTILLARLLLRVPFGESLIAPLVAIGAMALTILLNARIGLLCGLVTSLLCAVMAREDSTSFAAITTIGLVGALLVSEIATWAQLARAILVLGLVSASLSVVTSVMRETSLGDLGSVAAFSGGIGAISVVIAAGLAVFLGRFLGITTHLSLLELASPDEPVLRRMQSEAPGTYTHSLMVAQLSEAGAKATGADALLCRVGGLYHDVGKLRRPHCFIENQSGVNVHDRLSPQLSALLIIAHVKDGLELARALRLPRPVHAIIEQHHGTDLVSYFYHRAQQATLQSEQLGLVSSTQTEVDEALFRYRGPRPQSKEAAIVMLADAVEASSRALPDLTPEKLESHIKAMISKRLLDGELADCELTMRDLGTVEKAFAHVLRGALHQRIEYPDPSRDLKNEQKDAPNWTNAVLRDPQSESSRRRAARNRNARPETTQTRPAPADLSAASISSTRNPSESGASNASKQRRFAARKRNGVAENRAETVQNGKNSNENSRNGSTQSENARDDFAAFSANSSGKTSNGNAQNPDSNGQNGSAARASHTSKTHER